MYFIQSWKTGIPKHDVNLPSAPHPSARRGEQDHERVVIHEVALAKHSSGNSSGNSGKLKRHWHNR